MKPASSVSRACCLGLSLLCLGLTAGRAPLGAAEQVVDRVVRYVNSDIITAADQWDLVRLRIERMRRDGQPLPADQAAWRAFRDEVLEDITAETLKVQEAEKMGVSIDRRPLKHELRLDARRYGYDLATQARLLEAQIRRQKVMAIERYFSSEAERIGPAELEAAYRERANQFTRPARFHAWRLVLRPSSEAEQAAIFQQLLGVFRELQVAQDPALQAVVTPERRQAYVAKRDDRAAQLELLLAVAEDALAARPAGEGAGVLEQARQGVERHAALRSLEQVEATLAALRAELVAIEDPAARLEAFTAAVRRISEGPQANLGGDLGWMEPGEAGSPYDAVLAGLEAGEVSPIVADGEARALLLVSEREAARQRSLAEVSAELRSQLERERREAAIERLESALRARAHIQDLEPLSVEDIQAAAGVLDNAEVMQEQVEERVAEEEEAAGGLQAPGVDALAE